MDHKQLTSSKGLYTEFLAELQAHSYGIRSYTLPQRSSTSGLQYHCTICLLNSSTITVTLSAASGYSVEQHEEVVSFESLTALLSELSPDFNSAMHRSLSARLLSLGDNKLTEDDKDDDDDNEDNDNNRSL